MHSPLLKIEDLVVEVTGPRGFVRAVDELSLEVGAGQTVGLVGESGCGKSLTALSIIGLLDSAIRVRRGHIWFAGRDLLELSERELRALRGDRIAMVFQEPMSALNPVQTVGAQIAEAIAVHRSTTRRAARHRAIELLEAVEFPDAVRRATAYPHELSGGMRQRVVIAMAIAGEPSLLLADEPTTALDVTVQAQILDLLRSLRERLGMAVLLITHDLGVVATEAERVAIMYSGRIVEEGATADVFAAPAHPYSRGLLASLPSLRRRTARLDPIPGTVPEPGDRPSGCRFRDRCERAVPDCAAREPALVDVDRGFVGERRAVACWAPTTAGAAG